MVLDRWRRWRVERLANSSHNRRPSRGFRRAAVLPCGASLESFSELATLSRFWAGSAPHTIAAARRKPREGRRLRAEFTRRSASLANVELIAFGMIGVEFPFKTFFEALIPEALFCTSRLCAGSDADISKYFCETLIPQVFSANFVLAPALTLTFPLKLFC